MDDLISKSKLFEWIKVELAKEYPDSVAQYVDGRETLLEILRHRMEQGAFSPDPIPLPTIKPGDKVRHRIHNEWGIGEVKECYPDGSGVRCFFPDLRLLERTKFLATVDLEVSHD